jgi:hypothetical protein
MATIVEQTFSATMNELENKTWYIDSWESQYLTF